MKNKIKYYYFFQGTLTAHVDLYKGWVDTARKNGLPMEMVTFLSLPTYVKQYRLVKHYRKFDYINIIITLPGLSPIITLFFFLTKAITNEQLVIHLRKQPPNIFVLLKKLFKKRIKYMIELEGDPLYEKEYLTEHPYKENFYKEVISGMEKHIRELPNQLNKTDYILTVTEELKDLLDKRYPKIKIKEKISVIPTGVDIDKIYFSENTRVNIREKLNLQDKFVIIYTGNAYYSWQNVYRTIEIFKLIKNKVAENAFLILLVRKEDHNIVKEFIDKLNLSDDEYILTQVDHEEIGKYLNASDLGVLLRHNHLMNEAASPGKFGEYLAAGLPVLTTKIVAKYPKEISENNYGIILNDMDNDDEIIKKIVPFLKYDKEKRMKIREWTRRKFSTDAYSQVYVNALIGLATNE
jgi:glycosyltransferase involved in cell wall biosynthesis